MVVFTAVTPKVLFAHCNGELNFSATKEVTLAAGDAMCLSRLPGHKVLPT